MQQWSWGGAPAELRHAPATAAGSATAGSEAGEWMLAAGMRQRSDKQCVSINDMCNFVSNLDANLNMA
jgi:hypothetical protein